MDYSFLFWAMIVSAVVIGGLAIFIAKRLDKKSKGD